MRGREPRLGEEIEKIRREKGMKQSDLCVNERYYRDIVAGKRIPPEDTLLKLLTDQTEGLGMTDVSIIERILKRYGFSALTPEQKNKYLMRLSPRWEGLVAWYPLEGSAADKSGKKNHGVSSGVRFPWADAIQVGSFDGCSHILVRDNPSLRLTTFTLSAWVKPARIEGGPRIVEKGQSNSYWLYLMPDGSPRVGFFDGSDHHNVRSRQPLPTNTWHFVSGTFDKYQLLLCVDALLEDFDASHQPRMPVQNDEPLIVGWKHDGLKTDHFIGLISDVQIYDRDLSLSEIRDLYNYGKSTHRPDTILNAVP